MRRAHRGFVFAVVGAVALAAAPGSPPTTVATGGSRVAFVSGTAREPYRSRAVELAPQGTRSVQLKGKAAGEASFSPKGGFLVYNAGSFPETTAVLTRFGGQRHLVIARTRCRPTGTCAGQSHGWAPDGRKVVLSVWDGSRRHVSIFDRASARRREVTPRETTSHDQYGDPSWSPNGRLIGFIRHYGFDDTNLCCKLEYHVTRPDGSGHRWIYQHRRGDTAKDSLNFAWAPDSRRLAFTWVGAGGFAQLGLVEIRTRRLRWLRSPVYPQTRPAWSPDSRRIAVATPGAGITLVDPTGRERPKRLVPRLAVWDVAFAADGRSLIASVATGAIGSSPKKSESSR